jgi:hypothetical protein
MKEDIILKSLRKDMRHENCEKLGLPDPRFLENVSFFQPQANGKLLNFHEFIIHKISGNFIYLKLLI